jgi:hypothetical protein
MQREIISRKRFMEAVRQFGPSTIGIGVLINSEQKMMGPVKVGKSHGVEVYHANVTFQSVMAGWALYIYASTRGPQWQ